MLLVVSHSHFISASIHEEIAPRIQSFMFREFELEISKVGSFESGAVEWFYQDDLPLY